MVTHHVPGDIAGEQFVQILVFSGWQLFQDVAQAPIGTRIRCFGGFDQAVESGTRSCAVRAAREKPVFAVNDEGADGVLYQVVVERDMAVFQELQLEGVGNGSLPIKKCFQIPRRSDTIILFYAGPLV